MDHVLIESPAMLLKAVRAAQIIAGADPIMTMALHDEGIDLLSRGADRSVRIRVPGPVNTAPFAMRVEGRALMHALAALIGASAPPLALTAMDDPRSIALQCGDVRISLPVRKADPPAEGPDSEPQASYQTTLGVLHTVARFGAACTVDAAEGRVRPELRAAIMAMPSHGAGLLVASMDGVQIAAASDRLIEDVAMAEAPSALINAQALKATLRALKGCAADSDEPVVVAIRPERVAIHTTSVQALIDRVITPWPHEMLHAMLRLCANGPDVLCARPSSASELGRVMRLIQRISPDRMAPLTIQVQGPDLIIQGTLTTPWMSGSDPMTVACTAAAPSGPSFSTMVDGVLLAQAWHAFESGPPALSLAPWQNGRSHVVVLKATDPRFGVHLLRAVMPLQT